jgi:hypothetical protein
MRKLLMIAACLALPLTSCSAASLADAGAAVVGLPSAPVAVCDKSKLDEQAGTGVELGYKLFRTGVELATDLGAVKGQRAVYFANLDSQLFAGTQAVQLAYATCNASSYKAAVESAQALLKTAQAALAAK